MIASIPSKLPPDELNDLIYRYGRWKILRALLRRESRQLPEAASLPNYLRRDIGLPPLPHVAIRDLML
jgi:hypothetical protein